jgi:hypothetical protein
MKRILILSVLLFPLLSAAQKAIDITGRVSSNTLYFDYDEKSKIKPDTVSSDTYGKASLIPGLQQQINLSIFARTKDLDISLLSDFRVNKWDEFDLGNDFGQFLDQKSLERFSLNMRFFNHEVILGDFYESGSEFFIQSREMRGAKANFNFERLWNRKSFLEINTVIGRTQRAVAQGERLQAIYKQYESSGQFRRYMAAVSAKTGEQGLFKIGLHYLWARDDQKSIDASLNDALQNQNIGMDASVFFWDNNVQLFAEGFYSTKDTLDYEKVNDHSYKGGIDFRYEQFKMIAFYQRIGADYYSAGYPFLLNDRQGARVQAAYSFPKVLIANLDGEFYDDNLKDDDTVPTTKTRIGEMSVTTQFKNVPEFTLLYGYRDDISDLLVNEGEESKTDKISKKYEFRVSHDFSLNRLSLSTIFLDLNDFGKVAGDSSSLSLLGTEQFIASLNFYTRPSENFFISGGGVYSRLLLTNNKESRNIFVYQSSRWDIVPRTFILESTITGSRNDASKGGTDDLLNDYWQIDGRLSIEYFFNLNISLKLIAGTNRRQMDYSTQQARQALLSPDIEPTFFNGNESYNALIYGAEINWIF